MLRGSQSLTTTTPLLRAVHTGQHKRVHSGSTRSEEWARAGFQRRPGGVDIIDEQDPPTCNLCPVARRHDKCATDIALPLRGVQPALGRRGTVTLQQVRAELCRASRFTRESAGQQGRLVEAPSPEPQPVQWHRRDQVGIHHQFTSRPRQPASEGRRTMGPVAMLEAGDQITADIVVEKHRTRSLENGPRPHTGPAQGIRAMIAGKRHPAGLTERGGDKRRAIPASRTQGTGFGHQCVTGQALGRQYGIEHGAQGAVGGHPHHA
jgi:hypothetical protein